MSSSSSTTSTSTATPTSTDRINIAPANVYGNCDLKCAYNFKYAASTSSVATNQGQWIEVSYDAQGTPPVLFNEAKYLVEKLSLVAPSIHLFNNAVMPGELIVTHTPMAGGNTLKVCVPLSSSADTTTASGLLTDLIAAVAEYAPSEGDSTAINIANFSLQQLVPKKPFYTYEHDRVSWVVYGDLEAIPLTSDTLATLQEVIAAFPIPTPGAQLFYNAKGPVTGIPIGDGLYISCQPTGSSEDETAVVTSSSSSSSSSSSLFRNPVVKYIALGLLGLLVFLGIFYAVYAAYNYASSSSSFSSSAAAAAAAA